MATGTALRRAIWQLRVTSAFVVCGGYVGGLAVIVVMTLVSLSTVGAGTGDVSALLRSLMFTPLFALFGIAFGFPAAFASALAFLVAPPTWRARLPMAFIGAGSGAVWALVMSALMGPITPHSDFVSIAGSAVLFAIAGAAGAIATLWLLARWNLSHFECDR